MSMSFGFKRNFSLPGCFLNALIALAALFAFATAMAPAQTTVPAILPVGARTQYNPTGITVGGLTYSTSGVYAGYGSSANGAIVQRDAAGDIFILDSTPQVLEIPASGPFQVAVPSTDYAMTSAKTSGGAVSMTVDPAGNIYISGSTTATLIKITRTSTGGYSLGSTNETNVISLLEGSCDGYYLQLKGAFAVDASGNIYGIMYGSTATSAAGIIAGGPTIGGCKYIYGSNNNTPALTADPLSIAVDGSGDVLFVDGVSVKEITAAQVAAATVSTPAVPTVIGNGSCTGCTGLSLPSAITIDAAGNLIVGGKATATTDAQVSILPLNAGFSGSTPIYLLPTTISGTSSAAGYTTVGAYVATDNQGDFYSVNGTAIETYGSGSYQVANTSNYFGYPYAASIADSNTTKTPTVGFLFTQATALASPYSAVIPTGAPYGGPASPTYPQFKQASTTCGATQAVGSTCFTTVAYSPKFPGNAFGAVVLYGTGPTIASEVTVQAIFTGPAVAIDDGTKTTVGTGYVTPSGMAVDASGNMYVADRGANAVYKYAPGTSSSGTTVVTTFGTGVSPASLSTPSGVAFDAAGDLFVADTGNNRVLYMPNNSGTLGAAQVVSVTGFTLNAPRGVAFDGFGKLYIADTGNSRILRMSNPIATSITLPATVGSGFSSPVAMAFDQFQDMFVADSGLTSIVEIQGGFGFTVTSTANYGGGNGTSTPTMVGSGLSSPTGVAVDGSGTVYVADGGNSRVVKIPYTGGAYGTATVLFSAAASDISKPYGLVLDVTGDIYFTDSDQPGLYFAQRSQPNGSTTILLPLMLPDAAVSASSTASTTLSNQGYVTSLNETVGALAAPFSLSTNGCANAALAAGASCTDVVTFTGPATTDTTNTANLVFTTNEQNLTTSPTTTISLTGASTGAVASVAITGAATITYGETETYTVTAYDNGTPARPAASANGTQTITITGCGSFSPTVTLAGGTGNFLLPSVTAGRCALSVTIAGVPGSLNVVVNKAPLTISASPVSRVFDIPNPTFSSLTYSGFVNGDTSSVVSGTPAFATTATRVSPAGTYPITVTGTFTAANYTIALAAGTLTVTGSAPQVVLFDALPGFTGGSTVTLVGISTSGLPLSYSTNAGSISGNVLTVPATGTAVTVTASQAGNASYAAATSVTRSFTAQ